MLLGFDQNNNFYVDYVSCTRKPGTLREEADSRAREIYANNKKVMLCLSSGLDSQIALHSFMSQGIPLECTFLRMGGYNDNELENVKILEKKYGFKAHIIDMDPNSFRDEIEDLKIKLDAHANHCIQYKFVSMLPKDYDVIQVLHDPWIYTNKNLGKHYLFHGYYDPEIARYRVLKSIERTGEIHMFGDSSEFFLSCISDDLFKYFFNSWIYYDGNGLQQYGKKLADVLRYEYYVKPMLYSKHWGNELSYFPKFSGYENIEWLMKEVRVMKLEKFAAIEVNELISHLSKFNGETRRFTQYKLPF